MKKRVLSILAAALLLCCLTACGAGAAARDTDDGKLRIVATVFPAYDWLGNVLGENPADAEVTWLLDGGVDLHSYQPTVADLLKISTCDLFIYVGGESDAWVEDALKQAVNQDMRVVNLLDVLGDAAREETRLEGMQTGDGEEEEETEYDEHVWLSLRNAAVFTDAISGALQALDGAHAETYRRNAAAYREKLDALDGEYRAAVAGASGRTLLFGDRFPFLYLAEDYGLTCYAAFSGCSAETEASFETVSFLARKVDELGLHAVMTLEGSDHALAETIVQNTRTRDQLILSLDSLQSVKAKDAAERASYLSVMGNNLSVLKQALE